MDLPSLRKFCKRLPHVTEDVKWGNDLCFLIGGKMFTVACLDPADAHAVSFKCTPEEFAALVEQPGIIPAPYMARNHWVTLERFDALRDKQIEAHVRNSYELVKGKLTKSAQAALEGKAPTPATAAQSKAGAARSPAKKAARAKR
jgi:predicted DNA-binding protein (MmcQ/YjbR family)